MSEVANSCIAEQTPDADKKRNLAPRNQTFHLQWPWIATWLVLLSLSAFTASMLVLVTHAKSGFFTITLATAICILAALFDAWTTRIPNWLTYTAIGLGLLINAIATLCSTAHLDLAAKWLAAPGISQSLLGFSVCAAVGIAALLLAKVGGGDIKLLAVLGAFLGLADIGPVLIIALTVAVIYALLNLAVFGKLNALLRVAAMRTLELLYLRRFQTVLVDEKAKGLSMIPMAIPLALGLILSQILNLKALLNGGHP